MRVCANCGRKNPDDARFCNGCAASFEPGPASREVRKTVTVVFCDVASSTALGESTDPEALRALLARYFDRMRGIVERHGGSVEKFIGDAVMAVFGVPVAHEDDALRACRAAVEMRQAFPELGISCRIGVNTGRVVTGTEERLATGDAINVAARLEQAAAPGELLVGEATLRLVRDAVAVGEMRALQLKGKSALVAAYPLIRVTGELERRFGTPMVGRANELLRLRAVFDQVIRDRSCQLFTILGSAGVGKSRLAGEFLSTVEARVVRARCLSYGDGITYWPVVEILRQLGPLRGEDKPQALGSLLGESDASASVEEIAWAFRKLLEQEAQSQPLVCVFDDLHWGEETLLDLVEHVADLSRGAPILLLCVARPDLLERRRGWSGGKWNATTVLLEPLDGLETERLLAALGGVPDDLGARIVQVAEGNPLFLEEMLAFVRDSGGAEVDIPPTIQALVTARLDQLVLSERAVLERGSIEGRTFHRGAVAALGDDSDSVDERLIALVRKELLRPDRSVFAGDDAFRFRHLLIRDAAYEALPKALRAGLHERFVDWLETKIDERGDQYEALVGHHLEAAHRYRSELGVEDRGIAERAGRSLARAGRAASARGDSAATVHLLARSLALLGAANADRAETLIALGHAACDIGEYGRASEAAQELIALGREHNDARLERRGRMLALWVRLATDPTLASEELRAEVEAAVPILMGSKDEAGLARAYHLLGQVYHVHARALEHIEALERALPHTRNAGDKALEAEILSWLGVGYVFGPTPVEQGQTRLEQILAEAREKSLVSVEGITLSFLGGLQGLCGNFEAARVLFRDGRTLLREIGLSSWIAGQTQLTGYIEMLAGDYAAAEREFRHGYDEYERMGETAVRSTHAALLAEALYEQGRHDESARYLQICRETAAADDYASQVAWRVVAARLLAGRGELAEAERTLREAIGWLVDDAPSLWDASAWTSLGETLALGGNRREAEDAFAHAVRIQKQKGNAAGVARTEELAIALGLRD